jgi:proteic killer suppression protein
MDVTFKDLALNHLETDPATTGGYPPGVVKAFRKRMQGIRSADDERNLHAMKSWHFEKLKGRRDHQRSIKLNDQYRLILELEGSGEQKRVLIIGIEDYH